MREIRFRGKRIDNGEWLYGDLIQYEHGTISIRNIKTWLTVNVIPETVGQYTGLKDKNGTEIYEGDLLECDTYPGENYWLEIAKCEEPPHVWISGWRKKPTSDVRGISDGVFNGFDHGDMFEHCVVIGNIHENPELLEAAKWT